MNTIFPDDEAADKGVERLYELIERMKQTGFVEDSVRGEQSSLIALTPKGDKVRRLIKDLDTAVGREDVRNIFIAWNLLTSRKPMVLASELTATTELVSRMVKTGLVEIIPDPGGTKAVSFELTNKDACDAIRDFETSVGPLSRRDAILVWIWFRVTTLVPGPNALAC